MVFSKLSYGHLDWLKMIPQGAEAFSTIENPIPRTSIFLHVLTKFCPWPIWTIAHMGLSPYASLDQISTLKHRVFKRFGVRPSVARSKWRGRCHRLPACATKVTRHRRWGPPHSPLTIPPGPLQPRAVWGMTSLRSGNIWCCSCVCWRNG